MSDRAAYGGKNWAKLWQKLEQEGNVGIDYVINPYLYSGIADFLIDHPSSRVVDFGAGTNILAIQFMYGYQAAVPGLQPIKALESAREHVREFIGLEGDADLVDRANSYLRDLGYPTTIRAERFEVSEDNKLPVKSGSVSLAVSRNFLMHLEQQDLQSHLAQVARSLTVGGRYITAFLNPDYEQKKYKEQNHGKQALLLNEKYSFTHGGHGEHGIFYHYWKDIDTYNRLFRKDFKIVKKEACLPITTLYKKDYPRYYQKNVPMAFMYILERK